MKYPFEKKPEHLYSAHSAAVLRLLSLLSTALVVWCVGCCILSFAFSASSLLFLFPFVFVGFLIQWLLQKGIGLGGEFHFWKLLPASLLMLPIAIGCGWMICQPSVQNLVELDSWEGDLESLAVFSALLLFGALLSGAVVSLFSVESFFSYSSATFFIILYVILQIFSLFSSYDLTAPLLISACLTTVFFFFGWNQVEFQKLKNDRIRVLGLTAELKRKNIRLITSLFPLLAVTFFLALVVVTGVYFLGKALLLLGIRSLLSSSSHSTEELGSLSSDLFFDGLFPVPSLNRLFFALFLILAAVCLTLFITRTIFERTFSLSAVIRAVKNLFLCIFSFIKSLKKSLKKQSLQIEDRVEKQRMPYRDTVSRFILEDKILPDNYRLFWKRLEAIPDVKEQFCYAYTVLLEQWISTHVNGRFTTRPGCTPRELVQILAKDSYYDIGKYNQVFEQIRYAQCSDQILDQQMLLTQIVAICTYIEQNFHSKVNLVK